FHGGLCPTDFYWGDSHRRIVRIPYCWEDDVAAAWPGWAWNGKLPHGSGLAVLDFHPVNVALNVKTMEGYQAIKSALGRRRLFETTPCDFVKHVNRGTGARTYLEGLLSTIPRTRWRKISEIADEWRASG